MMMELRVVFLNCPNRVTSFIDDSFLRLAATSVFLQVIAHGSLEEDTVSDEGSVGNWPFLSAKFRLL